MKLANALKLSEKHGTVLCVENNCYQVQVNETNIVEFRLGRKTASNMLRHMLGEDVPEEVVEVIHIWKSEDSGEWQAMGCRTLAGALCNAKWTSAILEHSGVKVVIEERYAGATVKRQVKVTVDGAEVNYNHPGFEKMVDGALESKCCAPLLDWIEDHTVAKSDTLILV